MAAAPTDEYPRSSGCRLSKVEQPTCGRKRRELTYRVASLRSEGRSQLAQMRNSATSVITAANGNDSRPIVAPTKSTEKRACKGYASALARSFGSMFTDLRHGTESYPAPEPGTGAGLSGAPPTETGPKGLGSGETIFRVVRTSRARVFECEMLEVVSGAPHSAERPPAPLARRVDGIFLSNPPVELRSSA